MSVEFRQRRPGEYARILKKRKWLIILPTIAVTLAVTWAIWRIQNVYESRTLLIVKPSTIPNAIVPTLSDIDLSMRINNIGQMVTSRTSLEPLIIKYDLYRAERAAGEPMELIIEKMRKDIVVEVDKTRDDVTNAFKISYRERDPRHTQMVTAELASKYVNAQTESSRTQGEQTIEFFNNQAKEAKDQLDEIDRRRLEYMQQNVGSLPSESQSMVGQLTGLREQQKAVIAEIGRLQDQRTALSSQISDIKKQRENDIENASRDTTDPKTTIAYAELAKRRAELEAEVQNMLTTLTPKNPDVIAKQAQMASIQREIDKMIDDWQAHIKEKKERLANNVDLRLSNYEANLKMVESEIIRQQSLQGQIESQISELNGRLNNVPGTEVALEGLNNEYKTKKVYYDELLDKQQKAKIAAEVQTRQQGETLEVVDPANLPQKPVSPKRLLFIGFGFIVGLCMGLFMTAVFEVPQLLTIQTSDDAEHYTNLPVLATVPQLLTPHEAQLKPARRLLLVGAGVLATIAAIPALAYALKFSHLFERFMS